MYFVCQATAVQALAAFVQSVCLHYCCCCCGCYNTLIPLLLPQEEELKAAVDKAVEAETRAHEAELKAKDLKVSVATWDTQPAQHSAAREQVALGFRRHFTCCQPQENLFTQHTLCFMH
jgi:hypothetical protein